MKPSIGTLCDSKKILTIDVQRLIDTRLLVQSNSGGGKSWCLRRLLEQMADHVQEIILDTEGEFSSLREKFDYVICAPQGADAVATPATAVLLARRLRETRVSAIIDLYELKMSDRRRFVRLFLEELIDAPKQNWYPALVVVDEAHLYAPEKGEAESLSAVVDLASRGRKRGLCAVLATQRLSKLHKDAAAELLNKLVGRTGLDIDVKRAADELGMNPREAIQTLRNLDPGEFYVFGPALSKAVEKIEVGPVVTKHPKAGSRQMSKPPAPSDRIKKILADLSDLPKSAEHEARTLADIRSENIKLKREISVANRLNDAKTKRIDVPVITKSQMRQLKTLSTIIDAGTKRLTDGRHALDSALTNSASILREIGAILYPQKNNNSLIEHSISAPIINHGLWKQIHKEINKVDLGKCERSILTVLAQHGEGCNRTKLTLLTGYTFSGSFQNSLGKLRASGYIVGGNSDVISVTEEGLNALGDYMPLPMGRELRDYWLRRFGKCERSILQALFEHNDGLSKEQLCDLTGYSFSGSFQNSLGKLRTANVISGGNNEIMRASSELMK